MPYLAIFWPLLANYGGAIKRFRAKWPVLAIISVIRVHAPMCICTHMACTHTAPGYTRQHAPTYMHPVHHPVHADGMAKLTVFRGPLADSGVLEHTGMPETTSGQTAPMP